MTRGRWLYKLAVFLLAATGMMSAAIPRARLCLSEIARLAGDQPFLVGERISLADLMVFPLLYYFEKMPEGDPLFAEQPSLRAWLRRIEERQSVAVTKPPPFLRN